MADRVIAAADTVFNPISAAIPDRLPSDTKAAMIAVIISTLIPPGTVALTQNFVQNTLPNIINVLTAHYDFKQFITPIQIKLDNIISSQFFGVTHMESFLQVAHRFPSLSFHHIQFFTDQNDDHRIYVLRNVDKISKALLPQIPNVETPAQRLISFLKNVESNIHTSDTEDEASLDDPMPLLIKTVSDHLTIFSPQDKDDIFKYLTNSYHFSLDNHFESVVNISSFDNIRKLSDDNSDITDHVLSDLENFTTILVRNTGQNDRGNHLNAFLEYIVDLPPAKTTIDDEALHTIINVVSADDSSLAADEKANISSRVVRHPQANASHFDRVKFRLSFDDVVAFSHTTPENLSHVLSNIDQITQSIQQRNRHEQNADELSRFLDFIIDTKPDESTLSSAVDIIKRHDRLVDEGQLVNVSRRIVCHQHATAAHFDELRSDLTFDDVQAFSNIKTEHAQHVLSNLSSIVDDILPQVPQDQKQQELSDFIGFCHGRPEVNDTMLTSMIETIQNHSNILDADNRSYHANQIIEHPEFIQDQHLDPLLNIASASDVTQWCANYPVIADHVFSNLETIARNIAQRDGADNIAGLLVYALNEHPSGNQQTVDQVINIINDEHIELPREDLPGVLTAVFEYEHTNVSHLLSLSPHLTFDNIRTFALNDSGASTLFPKIDVAINVVLRNLQEQGIERQHQREPLTDFLTFAINRASTIESTTDGDMQTHIIAFIGQQLTASNTNRVIERATCVGLLDRVTARPSPKPGHFSQILELINPDTVPNENTRFDFLKEVVHRNNFKASHQNEIIDRHINSFDDMTLRVSLAVEVGRSESNSMEQYIKLMERGDLIGMIGAAQMPPLPHEDRNKSVDGVLQLVEQAIDDHATPIDSLYMSTILGHVFSSPLISEEQFIETFQQLENLNRREPDITRRIRNENHVIHKAISDEHSDRLISNVLGSIEGQSSSSLIGRKKLKNKQTNNFYLYLTIATNPRTSAQDMEKLVRLINKDNVPDPAQRFKLRLAASRNRNLPGKYLKDFAERAEKFVKETEKSSLSNNEKEAYIIDATEFKIRAQHYRIYSNNHCTVENKVHIEHDEQINAHVGFTNTAGSGKEADPKIGLHCGTNGTGETLYVIAAKSQTDDIHTRTDVNEFSHGALLTQITQFEKGREHSRVPQLAAQHPPVQVTLRSRAAIQLAAHQAQVPGHQAQPGFTH